MSLRVKYYGVRGSIPVSGPGFDIFGGETTCVLLEYQGEKFILDTGTGIRILGADLLREGFGNGKGMARILFTHTHWDHIQGFPFFVPAYIPGNLFEIYGETKTIPTIQDNGKEEMETWTIKKTLHMQQQFMYFPIATHQMSSEITFHELIPGTPLRFGNLEIHTLRMQHPNSTLAYRFSTPEGDYVFATDFEHGNRMESKLAKFAKGAKAIAVDAQYTPEEYEKGKTGWGHSTYAIGAWIAEQGNVQELHLIHHDPTHSDADLKAMEASAKKIFPQTVAIPQGYEYHIS